MRLIRLWKPTVAFILSVGGLVAVPLLLGMMAGLLWSLAKLGWRLASF